jgi:hypothetical protein
MGTLTVAVRHTIDTLQEWVDGTLQVDGAYLELAYYKDDKEPMPFQRRRFEKSYCLFNGPHEGWRVPYVYDVETGEPLVFGDAEQTKP